MSLSPVYNSLERAENGGLTNEELLIPLSYVIPITSTDYKGLENIDPRLVDREWRLNNLYKIINKHGNLVRFKLNDAQRKLLSEIHYKNIILKARQLGFTTFICIFMLDYALFNSYKNVGILAHTQSDAAVIFRKVKIAWDNFPKAIKEFLHLETTEDSKVEYKFTNHSVMRIATSLRSGTYQMILITEFGKVCAHFPDKADETITGTLPAVPNNGVVFIESTAEGEGGHYYDMVQIAREMKMMNIPLTNKDFKFFFFPWFDNPENQIEAQSVPIDAETNRYLDTVERDIRGGVPLPQSYRNWYYLEKKTQRDKMKQENPSSPDEAFLVSGNKMFSADVILAQRSLYAHDPLRVTSDGLRVFKEFVKGHVYGLGADVSLGVKRDSSTMCVIDFTTGEIVATYRSETIDPVMFAYEIKKVALMYGGCIAAPEANTVGILTCSKLNEIYANVYTQVRSGLLEEQVTQKLGWLSTPSSKPRMMNEFSVGLADDELKCHDNMILIEASKFNKEDALKMETVSAAANDSNAGVQTRHFDLLTSAAIAWQLRNYATKGMESGEKVAAVVARRAEHKTRQRSAYS